MFNSLSSLSLDCLQSFHLYSSWCLPAPCSFDLLLCIFVLCSGSGNTRVSGTPQQEIISEYRTQEPWSCLLLTFKSLDASRCLWHSGVLVLYLWLVGPKHRRILRSLSAHTSNPAIPRHSFFLFLFLSLTATHSYILPQIQCALDPYAPGNTRTVRFAFRKNEQRSRCYAAFFTRQLSRLPHSSLIVEACSTKEQRGRVVRASGKCLERFRGLAESDYLSLPIFFFLLSTTLILRGWYAPWQKRKPNRRKSRLAWTDAVAHPFLIVNYCRKADSSLLLSCSTIRSLRAM